MTFEKWMKMIEQVIKRCYDFEEGEFESAWTEELVEMLHEDYIFLSTYPIEYGTITMHLLFGAADIAGNFVKVDSDLSEEQQNALAHQIAQHRHVDMSHMALVMDDVDDISDEVPWTRIKWEHCVKWHLSFLSEKPQGEKDIKELLHKKKNQEFSNYCHEEARRCFETYQERSPQYIMQAAAKSVAMMIMLSETGLGADVSLLLERYSAYDEQLHKGCPVCGAKRTNDDCYIEPFNGLNLMNWHCSECGAIAQKFAESVSLEYDDRTLDDSDTCEYRDCPECGAHTLELLGGMEEDDGRDYYVWQCRNCPYVLLIPFPDDIQQMVDREKNRQ